MDIAYLTNTYIVMYDSKSVGKYVFIAGKFFKELVF